MVTQAELEKENKKIIEIKDKLRGKFKDKGLNKDKTEFEINKLDTEFLLHCFVNNIRKDSNDERLKFYIKYLESQI